MKYTNEQWITRYKKIYGNTYDYSKFDIDNKISNKCVIICKQHGEFLKDPRKHLIQGCPICSKLNKKTNKLTTQEFIDKAISIHGNTYDYSITNYINSHDLLSIICKQHGEFHITAYSHLNGRGCQKCGELKRLSYIQNNKNVYKQQFIDKANKIHNSKYDYSKVNYIDFHTKVEIICPIHGAFYQTPHNHISSKSGCPICKNSHLENEVACLLTGNNIEYYQQYKFVWLRYKSQLVLDFYLPYYNVAIECQGAQHFEPYEYFDGINGYNVIHERDIQKLKLCKEHGINILYYSNLREYDTFLENTVYHNKEVLIQVINNFLH